MAKTYSKMTDIEHVLNRPDTYIGSVSNNEASLFILESDKIVSKKFIVNLGFYKIFDEIIMNCIDASLENKLLDTVKVFIKGNTIIVEDNGGIPIVKSKDYDNKYLPEFLFGQLRTSSNYKDSDKRKTIGLNGLGAKGTNIFSTTFKVETADGKKQFSQTFSNNLSIINPPEVKKSTKRFTRITYTPDLARFQMDGIDDNHLNFLKKRTYDLAGLNPEMSFYFNDVLIDIKDFKQYCLLYEGISDNILISANSEWSIGIDYSEGFNQVSFVNGGLTFEGGSHVEYILDQIVNFLRPAILKKHKLDLKPLEIRSNLFLFISSTIINNSFSSQIKEKLKTNVKDFGSYYELPEAFLNALLKSSTVQNIIDYKKAKLDIYEKLESRKLTRAIKKVKLDNLIDCLDNKGNATIGIFEGFSSANGFIKNRDPKKHAAYLLRGKILNTYGLKNSKILKNVELAGLMIALGLDLESSDISKLRYSKLLIYTDMDKDGNNIASLLISFLAVKWPDLFRKHLVYRVLTPLSIIKKGSKEYEFFSESEQSDFIAKNSSSVLSIQYKKGLGALSDKDYTKMINTPNLLRIDLDDNYLKSIDDWFKKDSSDRKRILIN